MAPLGLAARVGIHAGEVETREGKAEGLTVHVAARLMAAAGSDEVLPTDAAGAAATPTSVTSAPVESAVATPGVIADSGGYWSDDVLAPGRYAAMALPGNPRLTVGDGWSVFVLTTLTFPPAETTPAP